MTKSAKWRDPSEFGEPTRSYRALLQLLMKIERGFQLDVEEIVSTYVSFIGTIKAGLACPGLREEAFFIFCQFCHLVEQFTKRGIKVDAGSEGVDHKILSSHDKEVMQLAGKQLDTLSSEIASLLNGF